MAFRLGYRPALDGVRGLAILGVMAIHSGAPLAKGGFLGVDLFFVLSGFLISGLLVAEWDRTAGVRLGSFYMRRALRLLPALVVLLLALGALSLTIPLPGPAIELRREILFTFFYVANWALAFGAMPGMGMLGHAWSLAIEEQFYLLWPLLLLLLLRAGLTRRTIALLAAGAVAAAAAWRLVLFEQGATIERLYFGFDTRCDALLAGCVAALYASDPERRESPERRRLLRAGAAVGGALLLWMAATTVREDAFLYRGGFTLFAVAGALVVFEVAESPSSAFARALAWRPLAHIGRISYGVYLWHWPIFLYLNVAHPDWSLHRMNAVGVAATFAVAELSFALVERPFLRQKARWTVVASSPAQG